MGRYFTAGANASAASNKTILSLTGGTTVRPTVDEIMLGCSQTPGDQAGQYALILQTAAGSGGTTPTPIPVPDPSSPAAITVARAGPSSEPTYTSTITVWQHSLHQRASWRYVCDQGKGFIAPATSGYGWGLRLVTATTSVIIDGTLYHTE